MKIKELISRDEQGFLDLCREHEVETLYAFGSVVRDDFDEDSDVDLIVEINEEDPLKKGRLLWSFYFRAKDFFNKEIDILPEKQIRNPILKNIIRRTKTLVYDRKGIQIS